MVYSLEQFADYQPRVLGEKNRRRAAVLIPIVEKSDGMHILFQVRSSKLDWQPGDVCFPGGRMERGESADETALRETCEELNVMPEQVEILGPSDWLMERHVMVYPYVGRLRDYQNTFSQDEVEEVFTVPLNYFMENEPMRYRVESQMKFPEDFPFDKIWGGKDYHWSPRVEDVLFWEYEDHVIWGLTAKMLDGFIDRLREMTEV